MCKHCNGTGWLISMYDPSGHIVEHDVCVNCLVNGDCPVCGEMVEDQYDAGGWFKSTCKKCGYDSQKELDKLLA